MNLIQRMRIARQAANVRFRPKRMAQGLYALLASPPPRDNSGCVINTIHPSISQMRSVSVRSWRHE